MHQQIETAQRKGGKGRDRFVAMILETVRNRADSCDGCRFEGSPSKAQHKSRRREIIQYRGDVACGCSTIGYDPIGYM